MNILDHIKVNKISSIESEGGSIHKILCHAENSFKGFGEVYTSSIKKDAIRAWKYHEKMTLNLTILSGKVQFVFSDGIGHFKLFLLDSNDLFRLTVPPNIWYGFKGQQNSIILSLTNIIHDEKEIRRKNINEIIFDW